MKETLRERISSMLNEYKTKKKHYEDLVHEYSIKSEWESAMKFDIKMRQIDFTIKDLEKALS